MNDQQDFIVEMIPHGKYVKVTAVDVKTGREVSIVGAASATQNDLRKLAVNKLIYVMKRERAGGNSSQTKSDGIEV